MRSDRIESIGGGGRGIGGVRGASGRGAVKPTLKGRLAEPKSAVKVKSPAKTKPAPPNETKALEKLYSTVSRGTGPGNKRTSRIFNSKNPSASGKASRPVVAPKKK
jgi:hypothetical protein